MEAKIIWKSEKYMKKRHGGNQCWNSMLKNKQIPILRSLFGSIFGAVRGVRGAVEFKIISISDFRKTFTWVWHAVHPRRGAAEKFFPKMDTESDPKIDAWTIRGSTFQVLGGFLRCLILDEFLIRKKLIAGGVAGSLLILRGEGGDPHPFDLGGGPF